VLATWEGVARYADAVRAVCGSLHLPVFCHVGDVAATWEVGVVMLVMLDAVPSPSCACHVGGVVMLAIHPWHLPSDTHPAMLDRDCVARCGQVKHCGLL
jgi:hypothetical protein